MPSKRDIPAAIELNDFLAEARMSQYTVTAGGETFKIDPPEIWGDDVAAAGAANDPVGMATAILGEEAYAKWLTAGGSANSLLGIVQRFTGMEPGN